MTALPTLATPEPAKPSTTVGKGVIRFISMKKYAFSVICLAVIIFSSGCSTLSVQREVLISGRVCNAEKFLIYGGTVRDAKIIVDGLFRSNPTPGGITDYDELGRFRILFGFLDLPLSFALDTALVPMSVPVDIYRISYC